MKICMLILKMPFNIKKMIHNFFQAENSFIWVALNFKLLNSFFIQKKSHLAELSCIKASPLL